MTDGRLCTADVYDFDVKRVCECHIGRARSREDVARE